MSIQVVRLYVAKKEETEEGRKERTNERTNKQANKQTNEGTNKGTKEGRIPVLVTLVFTSFGRALWQC